MSQKTNSIIIVGAFIICFFAAAYLAYVNFFTLGKKQVPTAGGTQSVTTNLYLECKTGSTPCTLSNDPWYGHDKVNFPKGPDGNPLPTGIGVVDTNSAGTQSANAYGVLQVKNGKFGVIFYDRKAVPHLYFPNLSWPGYSGIIINKGFVSEADFLKDASGVLQDSNLTKLISFAIVIHGGTDIVHQEAAVAINKDEDFTRKLVNALESGDNFPTEPSGGGSFWIGGVALR